MLDFGPAPPALLRPSPYLPPMRALLFLLFVLVAAAGCAAPQTLSNEHYAEVDSLRTAGQALKAQVAALQDSLQFADDVQTGYYYRERNTLLRRVEKLQYDLTVCGDGGRTISTLLADDLFEPASARLTKKGAAAVAGLAEQLKKDYGSHVIRVEGHTDSVPLAGALLKQYPSNWELAGARATAVVRQLTDVHQLPVGQIEAVSFGATRPVGRNDTAEGRRQNRRVRVAAIPR